MKKPGFSSERARPLKEGPLTKVASVMEARSLKSPVGIAMVEVAAVVDLSVSYSYLPFKDAFIAFIFVVHSLTLFLIGGTTTIETI